jgi:hypothetical protein
MVRHLPDDVAASHFELAFVFTVQATTLHSRYNCGMGTTDLLKPFLM